MSSAFTIHAEWEHGEYGPPEERATAAYLSIHVNGVCVTRAENRWSETLVDKVLLSACPLALWLAASWWRLRWEPALPPGSNTTDQTSIDWKMSHEAGAAGHGFLWPPLRFEADGENIDIVVSASSPSSKAMLRYVGEIRGSVPGADFERGVADFIELTLARLRDRGVKNSELEAVWREVQAERSDPPSAFFRQIEARMGFDPDEAPPSVIQDLLRLSKDAGQSAIAEIAPLCSGANPGVALERIIDMSRSEGISAAFDPALRKNIGRIRKTLPPWERGWELARVLRSKLDLKGAVSDELFKELFQLPSAASVFPDAPAGRRPLGLAVLGSNSNALKLFFRRPRRTGQRFEAARVLADLLIAPPQDAWRPLTDCPTARQKVQRAFASEFLCPIQLLRDFLDNDFSEARREEAAEFFEVSEYTVRSSLLNHNLLSRDVVDG